MNIIGKTILTSKTFWVNFLAIIFFIVQSFTSYVVPIEVQGYILAGINFLLRLVTKEPIVWKGVKAIK